MTKNNDGGYLDEIQERMDGDVFKAMLEVMARRVMQEENTGTKSGDRLRIRSSLALVWGKPEVMSRIARVVVPGFPHRVTQRGNRCGEMCGDNGDLSARSAAGVTRRPCFSRARQRCSAATCAQAGAAGSANGEMA